MTSEGEFEVCEVHSITGVTWDVPAGGGLGSLFKVSGEVLCCDGTGAFDKKVPVSAVLGTTPVANGIAAEGVARLVSPFVSGGEIDSTLPMDGCGGEEAAV